MRVPVTSLLVVGAMLCATTRVPGQPLADRLAGIRNGTVRLSYATRAMVCGNGQFIGFDLPDAFYSYTNGNDGYSVNVMPDLKPDCNAGPLRLVVVKTNGRVAELRAAVGVSWRASETAIDLGPVSAPAAADWLVGLAESSDDGVARAALLAAAAADSARIADRVLGLARNRASPASVRERAIRWATVVGAAERRGDDVDRTLRAIAAEAGEPVSVRERAIRELRATPENHAHLRSLFGRIDETSVRERILREVASDGTDEDVAWLRGVALDSTEPVVLRERAIRVLGELGPVEYLQEVYPRLDRLELRERVIRTVAERDDAEAAAWLRDIVLDDGERTELRDRAVRSLADAGASSAQLATLYDRVTSNAVKQRLIRVLGDRPDDVAAEKLAAIAAGDPDAALRREAARQKVPAGHKGDPTGR